MAGILSPPPPNSFLFPFLDGLPATRFVLAMSQEDGASAYSEDVAYRTFTLNGAPGFACTSRGIASVSLNGTSQYLTAADAGWNSPLKDLTLFCVHYRDAAPAGGQGLIGKLPGGTNNAYSLHYSAAGSLTGYVTSDGSATAVSCNRTTDTAAGWYIGVMRFTAGSEVKVWGKHTDGTYLTATASAATIASLHNSTAALYLGRKEAAGDEDYLAGDLALCALYGAALTDAVVEKLIGHCQAFGVG